MKQGNRSKISRPAYAKREAERQAVAQAVRDTEAANAAQKRAPKLPNGVHV
jgi:hypothetical protein